MDIKSLLAKLNQTKGSDLIIVGNNPVCLRINNVMIKVEDRLITPEEAEELIAPIVKKEELEKFRTAKELDTAYEDKASRYRVNLHYQKGSIGASIRRVPKEIPTLEELKAPAKVKEFTKLERGLVLVTGPTGCGKSTTQAAMINLINATRPCHIITVEEPIEFIHSPKMALIEQREVGFDTLSFGEALKHVLRQIPDVILIGEMRDLESIQMAITAAETGHLVISTLHTQDSVQSIDRIIDVFPPHQQAQIRTQLALCLAGIVAQELIPKADGVGLTAAFEVLVATPAVRNIIRKGSTQDIYSMIELGGEYQMQTMDSSLVNLLKSGAISKDNALTYAINRERMEKTLQGKI